MSKKTARAISVWSGKPAPGRRRPRQHVRKAARRTFGLVLLGIPVGVYLLYCLCHLGGAPHFHLIPVGSMHPQDGSPWGDRDSMMRQSATEPHPH